MKYLICNLKMCSTLSSLEFLLLSRKCVCFIQLAFSSMNEKCVLKFYGRIKEIQTGKNAQRMRSQEMEREMMGGQCVK